MADPTRAPGPDDGPAGPDDGPAGPDGDGTGPAAGPVELLVAALGRLPAADRDAVYSWLLRHGPHEGFEAQPQASSLRAAALAGLTPADLARPRAAAAFGQSLAANPAGQQVVPVRFPVEQHAQLREWCAEHGFSMATVIRGLVARFLEGQVPLPGQRP